MQSLASKMSKNSFKNLTINDCLKQFTTKELLSEPVMCGTCKQPQPCYKSLSIAEAPKVLILHLKRFDSIKKTKLSTHVSFPLLGLDLSQYTKDSVAVKDIQNSQSIKSSRKRQKILKKEMRQKL